MRFNIPTSDPGYSNGVFTIYTTGELPPLVANGTVIDGSTQPGFAGKPIIALASTAKHGTISRIVPSLEDVFIAEVRKAERL